MALQGHEWIPSWHAGNAHATAAECLTRERCGNLSNVAQSEVDGTLGFKHAAFSEGFSEVTAYPHARLKTIFTVQHDFAREKRHGK